MTVNRIITFAANALTAIAGVALIGLVGVIAVDVVFRNLGVFHIRGVLDYVALALIILSGCAIPAAFVGGRHLVVEMGTFAMKASSKARLEAIWLLLAVPMLAKLGHLVLSEGLHLATRHRTMGVLGWAPTTFYTPVAAALFLSAAACLVVGILKISGRSKF